MKKVGNVVAREQYSNIDSALESLKMEVLKGNKAVMFMENEKFHVIVWRNQSE